MNGWDEQIKRDIEAAGGYVGQDVTIGHCCVVTNPSKVVIHDRVRVSPFCLITTALEVGSNSHICSHAVLGGGSAHKITMGEWSFVGYGSQLFCASEDYSGRFGPVNEMWGGNLIKHGDIKFNDHSGVASQVIVMPGGELPEGCLIGAQSFVYDTKELDPWAVYLGAPLRFHRVRDRVTCLRLGRDPLFLK